MHLPHTAFMAPGESSHIRSRCLCVNAVSVRRTAGRVSHAIACGLDSHDAVEALRAAYRMDRLASGAGVEGFLARWIPEDFEQILPTARRILQSAAAA